MGGAEPRGILRRLFARVTRAVSGATEPPGELAVERVIDEQREAAKPRRSEPPTVPVVIGFDLGTSTTKVVMRTPFLGGGRSVAVPFGSGSEEDAYLLPTSLAVLPDRTTRLQGRAGAADVYTKLKIDLVDKPEDDMRVARAAIFIAHVLRRSVHWFVESQRREIGDFKPRWSLNIGSPSEGHGDELLQRRLKSAAQVGWVLARRAGDITVEAALTALKAESQADIVISVVPEFAAAALGYARSRLREPGLHVLVDVGALTVDVCGFLLSHDPTEDELRYFILAAKVDHAGAFMLHEKRRESLAAAGVTYNGHDLQPQDMVPSSIREYSSDLFGDLGQVDAKFKDRVTNAVMAVIVPLKTRRDPNSPKWTTGLPIFLCGGGSRLQLYRDSVGAAEKRSKGAWRGVEAFKVRGLPVPESLAEAGIDESTFGRLAVAYGLSFEPLEIGLVIPQNDTPDIEADRRRRELPAYVSKDQV